MTGLWQRLKDWTLPLRHRCARAVCHLDQHELIQARHEVSVAEGDIAYLQHSLEEFERLKVQMDQLLHHGIWPVQDVGDDPLPCVFLSSLPKSGTVYLTNLLYLGLKERTPQFTTRFCSHGLFPRDLLCPQRLWWAARGNSLVSSHVDASPANVQLLRQLQPRVQVHLRDPRQASLSFVHHCLSYRKAGRIVPGNGIPLAEEPFAGPYVNPPLHFYDQPREAQIDWAIEHQLPRCVEWVGEWLAVVDAGAAHLDVLLTTYDEFLAEGERAFVGRILDFFRVPPEYFRWPGLRKEDGAHYRLGSTDEWLRVFTPRQRARATAALPAEWLDRFGWLAGAERTVSGPQPWAA